MLVFKTFLKVLNKCKATIILYTVILVFFGAFNMKNSDNSINFTATKPDIYIENNDEYKGITKSLINYITENSNIIEIKNKDDALFYRDVNYIITIPTNFNNDFRNHKNPKIEIKSTGDYNASLAEMMVKRYLKVADIYNGFNYSEEELINVINDTLTKETNVFMTSSLDTDNLNRVTFFYNFTNYSILAGCIYVICLIISSFKEENIKKRTIISSMNYKKYNRQLLLSNSVFTLILWFIYIILSFILLGDIMFSLHGLFYIINFFVFTICALTIAFLLGNIINNKNAINGIINVIALGSSFLCGAFVPMEMLPNFVLKIAHILPSYWFIKTNELLKVTEKFNFETLNPIIFNMFVVILFAIGFIILNNIISKRKRNIA